MIVYQYPFEALMIILIVCVLALLFGNDGEKEKKEALKECNEAYERCHKSILEGYEKLIEREQQKKLLAELEQIKDDLPKEVEIKIGDQ